MKLIECYYCGNWEEILRDNMGKFLKIKKDYYKCLDCNNIFKQKIIDQTEYLVYFFNITQKVQNNMKEIYRCFLKIENNNKQLIKINNNLIAINKRLKDYNVKNKKFK